MLTLKKSGSLEKCQGGLYLEGAKWVVTHKPVYVYTLSISIKNVRIHVFIFQTSSHPSVFMN